jgi:hypothetical protein
MESTWILPTGGIAVVLVAMLAGILMHVEPPRAAAEAPAATEQATLLLGQADAAGTS